MDSERGRQLEEIIGLSRDMLARAKDNQWAEVAELEARRRTLVASCFAQPGTGQDTNEVAASIREILRLNHEVTELGKRARETLGSEIRTHGVGRAARRAYRTCAL